MTARFALAAGFAASLSVSAASADDGAMFSDDPELSANARAAIEAAERQRGADPYATTGRQGVEYLYGSGVPTLVCAPLRVCTIALQSGEWILQDGIHLGDTSRWRVTPVLGARARTMLKIKPVDAGLETNMHVLTNRREYAFALVSTRERYVPFLSFRYPEDAEPGVGGWSDYRRAVVRQAEVAGTAAEPVASAADLDFRYEVDACRRCRFAPSRVYNDGVSTYIAMPDGYGGELPAFAILDGGERHVANTRWRPRNVLQVDAVFRRGALSLGKLIVEIEWQPRE